MDKRVAEALRKQYAWDILLALYEQGEGVFSEILQRIGILRTYRYRKAREALFALIEAGLVSREVEKRGAVERWLIKLTERGEKLCRCITEI